MATGAALQGSQKQTVLLPFNTIQEGIDAATSGGTVRVGDGTYTGLGNRDVLFRGKAITMTSMNGSGATIVDCQGTDSDPHRGFVFENGETANTVLSGFTIRNGYAQQGGAIYCRTASPTIRKNIITLNVASSTGGGVFYCWYSSPTIEENQITGNYADYHGGGTASSVYDSATIRRNLISGNSARLSGGGLYLHYSSCLVSNNEILGNAAERGGAMSFGFDSSPRVVGNTVAGNSGGALDLASNDDSPSVIGNTIVDNVGGGIINATNSSVTVKNCILWNNGDDLDG